MKSLIKLKDLSVTFPSQKLPVLENISLEIKEGDRFLLVGRSGIGKSTLLYLLANIIPAMIYAEIKGSIIRRDFNTAIVMQNPPSQMVTPSVEQEIAFALENRGLPRKIIRKKVDNALITTGIFNLKYNKPYELSGGEMQKVSLAAAIASEPDLLLLDEPTSFLDGESSDNLIKLLKFVAAKTAIVVIEHKTELFLKYIRKVLFINPLGNLIHYENGLTDNSLISELKENFRTENEISLYEQKHKYGKGKEAHLPLLKVRNLSFSYDGKKKVLKNINTDMYKGETVVLMGPNGSGKTTFLENIAGFYKQTKNNVSLNEKKLDKYSRKELYSNLSYLPQNPEYFFMYQTVREEINSIEKYNSNKKILENPENLLFENYAGKLDQSPFNLSEGEKRRFTLDLSLYENKTVFLVDEPTYGLDYISYHKIIEIFLRLKQQGVFMLIATHDPELAFTISDRIFFLDNGSLIFAGSKKQYITFITSNRESLSAKWYLPGNIYKSLINSNTGKI
ncbi:MAG: ATP-binding cassette domain-containing protein [Spirochaetales bacterium]|nr:ATP-binding cassette domain-containing protein [Spirochaetales bacterium]